MRKNPVIESKERETFNEVSLTEIKNYFNALDNFEISRWLYFKNILKNLFSKDFYLDMFKYLKNKNLTN